MVVLILFDVSWKTQHQKKGTFLLSMLGAKDVSVFVDGCRTNERPPNLSDSSRGPQNLPTALLTVRLPHGLAALTPPTFPSD